MSTSGDSAKASTDLNVICCLGLIRIQLVLRLPHVTFLHLVDQGNINPASCLYWKELPIQILQISLFRLRSCRLPSETSGYNFSCVSDVKATSCWRYIAATNVVTQGAPGVFDCPCTFPKLRINLRRTRCSGGVNA